MSCCGIVVTQRGKQTLGMSLEAECDRASVGKQPKPLLRGWNDVMPMGKALCSQGNMDELSSY